MSWRNTKAPPPSPDIILESSTEGDDENEITLPIRIPVCDAEHIDASVEEVRNSPCTERIKIPTSSMSEHSHHDEDDKSPSFIRPVRPKTKAVFESSDEEDDFKTATSLDLRTPMGNGSAMQDVSTLQYDNFTAHDRLSSSTPMSHRTNTKKFQFKPRNIHPNSDNKEQPSLPEESSNAVNEPDDDFTKSFQLLEIDAGKPREGLTAATNAEVEGESVESSSDGTLDLADSVDSVKDDSDSVQVIQPRRIEPTYPNNQPLKTIFLDELPGRSAPSSTSSVIPPSAHHQVDRALTLLSKTIELIPQIGEEAPTPDGFKVGLYPHQAYGLQWLWWREHHFPGGGILADEMGLGKTVMIMALIMKSLAEGSPSFNKKENAWHTNDKKLIESTCTLIVVPASVIGQWELEIKEKTTGLRYYVYHGPNREKSAKLLSRYHIVLTTFPTMASDLPKEDERRYVDTPLAKIRFDRIILDEGHVIRNEKTNTANAACQINANHRWVVTGTPIHNKLADMHSLVKFIRLTPFDDPKLWDHWMGLKRVSAVANSQARLNIIGRALILRRTKQEVGTVGACPSIPPKHFEDVDLELNTGEQDIYDHLEAYAKSVFKKFMEGRDEQQQKSEKQKAADKYVASKTKPKDDKEVSFTTILTFLLRLRQCCVLPYLIHSMVADDVDSDADPNSSDLPEDDEIISLRNPVFAHDHRSIKILRLIEDLNLIRKMAREENKPMDKVVIVSQWTSFLDIVRGHLVNAGFSTCEINGTVKISERAGIMMKFNSGKSKPEVMLLSLTAGGVGLNLIGANHMFFMDLHWNPMLELQCQDRIHRFGQTKPVTIHRYITKDTIEQRVLMMQKGKLELASGLLENKTMRGALTIQEMKKLFDV